MKTLADERSPLRCVCTVTPGKHGFEAHWRAVDEGGVTVDSGGDRKSFARAGDALRHARELCRRARSQG